MLGKRTEDTDSPLDRAGYKESYWWLVAHQPDYAEALEEEVANGKSAYDCYRQVLHQTSRPELAKRILLAATYLHQGNG